MTEQWQELKETITEMCDNGGTGTQQEVCKFLANYMEILEKQMQQHCVDCTVIKKLSKKYYVEDAYGYTDEDIVKKVNEIIDVVNESSSVTPTRPTGQWFIDERPESNREVVCSNCDQPIFKYHKLDFDYRPKYCPNCGARMAEGEDKE